MYDEKGEYKEASRGFVEDAHGFATELKEMDEREIKNLKRISERLQGSYRKEERIALEYTLMGQMLLQFKKYLPTLLKNNLQSSYRDSTQGFYTRQKDEDTYT